MKIAIMQPYLLPYIGYWQLVGSVDKFLLYDNVNFIKKGFINSNFILVNDVSFKFTLPLLRASQNKLINEIYVQENSIQLLRTVEYSYKKAPMFTTVFPLIEEIFKQDERNLAKYIGNSMLLIANYLNISTSIGYASELPVDVSLRGQDKIIQICNAVGGSVYVNSAGGKDLYSKDLFRKSGIELKFLVPGNISYKQFGSKFIPSLSILDILMFCKVQDITNMLNGYKLL